MGINAQERRKTTSKDARIAERRAEGIALAVAKNIRMSPRKVRHVIDLIRGKDYQEAMGILNFTPNLAVEPILKVLKSAAANADTNLSLDQDRLYVKACFVDCGFTFKRMHPTTQGRARIIRRRTSHITIQLAERPRTTRATRAGGSI